MKNCKKITALILVLTMLVSLSMFAGYAEGEDVTEASEETSTTGTTIPTSFSSAEDLTYVEPTRETTTEFNIYDLFDPTQKEELADMGEGLRDSVSLWNKIMLRFKSFIETLLELVEQFSGLSFSI